MSSPLPDPEVEYVPFDEVYKASVQVSPGRRSMARNIVVDCITVKEGDVERDHYFRRIGRTGATIMWECSECWSSVVDTSRIAHIRWHWDLLKFTHPVSRS